MFIQFKKKNIMLAYVDYLPRVGEGQGSSDVVIISKMYLWADLMTQYLNIGHLFSY